jgi:sterol desaturase/sphingolipid hydroxylase (fatty acid hydroxylase superfamily)
MFYTCFIVMTGEQFYESITLVVIVLLVDFLERSRPGFAVDRKRDLQLNIMAILVVGVVGEAWKILLVNGFNFLSIGKELSLPALRGLPGAVKIFTGLVLADFSLYWVHRAMHRPALWPTHIFHHSIEQLWWLSGSRTSAVHLLLFAVPQVLIGYYILAFTPGEAGVGFSIGVVVNIWIHANLWVNLGPLEWIIITPNFHRVHHGSRGLSNKNMGFIFTFWDRIFGTYVDPRLKGKDFALGYASTRGRLLRMMVGF